MGLNIFFISCFTHWDEAHLLDLENDDYLCSKAELFFLPAQTASGSGNVLQNPDHWTNPRFQNSGDLKWIRVYQGTTSEHDSVVMGSSEVPKHATKTIQEVSREDPAINFNSFFPHLFTLFLVGCFFPSVVHSQVSRKSYSALGRCEGFFLLFPPHPLPCQLPFSAWQDMLGSTSATLKEQIRAGLSGETEVVTSTREASSPGFQSCYCHSKCLL